MRLSCAIAVMVFVGQVGAPLAGWSEATEEKKFGETQPDSSLLYVIRPQGARGGNSVGLDIFADTTLLMRLRGNAYGFAHVDPGTHIIWGSGCYREMEFVPGEVYYLLCGDLGMATITQEEGRAYLEQIKYYNPPDPKVETKRATKEAKAEANLPKVQARWEKRANFIELEPAPRPVVPTETAGLLRVPAYSRIELELMENVSSYMSELGQDVWFRVREDARVGEAVWLPAGTPVRGVIVEIHGARRGGGSGGLEIEITSVLTPDGTEVPLIGQLIDAGRHKLGKASRAAVAGGFFGAAMVKGRESFELWGEPWRAWTRYESWVPRFDPETVTQIRDGTGSAEQLGVRAVSGLQFNLEKHQDAADITVLVDSEASVSRVELRGAGDWMIPAPVPAKSIENRSTSVAATFDGWSLLRHLPPGPDPVPARFSGSLEDGTEFVAEGEISWLDSSPESARQ